MAWKQTLAKLKQDLKADPEPAAPPKPKPAPKPLEPSRSIEEEDAMFLAAMGRRVPPPPRTALPAAAPPPPAPPPPPEETDFQSAMQGLKGMKAVQKSPLPVASEPIPVAPQIPPPAPPPAEPVPEPPVPSAPVPAPPPVPTGPRLIHLAAGMAVEVDGTLDLRAHSVADARDRLLERLHDGRFLGWRTLHVHLGPEPELREMLQSCLQEAAPLLLQYAQAPIPMGGSQAWILYFHLA